jgi:hypothetical protein
MRHASDIQYRCHKIAGTGTASRYLTPLFQAWAESRRVEVLPGTLNLCADRDLVFPSGHISLRPWDWALDMPERKGTPGYDPRLYFVVLNGHAAWLFRWCEERHIPSFVGDTEGCLARRHCEIVTEPPPLTDFDGEVLLRFVGTGIAKEGAA